MDKNKKNTNAKKNSIPKKNPSINKNKNSRNNTNINNTKNTNTNLNVNSKKHSSTTNTSSMLSSTKRNSNIHKFNRVTSSSNKIHTFNNVENIAEKKNVISRKGLFAFLAILVIIFVLLIARLFVLQFIDGDWLKEAANRQQTTNRLISPQRGVIYDTTGKALAISAQVDTVSINPSKIVIKDDNGNIDSTKTRQLQENLAQAFTDIFELDYTETLAKIQSENSIETIAQKVEQDKITQLNEWMEENEFSSGINIDADVKRYYPYETLASNLIGFCGTDNQGLWGLESYWDEVLTGTAGKIVSTTDVSSDLIPDSDSTYIAAQNGSDITLSIDVNVQTIAEKYLEQACIENDCAGGGNVIIMRPSTGDILAMASYPDYNLNTPFEPNSSIADTWDTLSSSAKSTALNQMWGNKAVSYRYEPGSTFKIINAAVGLEEGIVDTDTVGDFYCSGTEQVSADTAINCWKTSAHGSETLRQALMNSCNPAFMQLGKRIGAETLYNYYDAFGLFDKTGIQTIGETSGYFWDLEDVGPVQLATMSFGQRFKITPLELVTAVSAIANDGVLMKPRIVTSVTNTDTGVVTTIEPEQVRQVVSSQTCDKLIDMLKSVVSDGTGRYGSVEGYTIAGKTGTSEPDSSNNDGYVASYIAIAPADNPEVVILVTLYDPPASGNHQGGQIAGPVVSQILSEVLPYLGVPSDTAEATTSSITSNTISVPDVRNKTVAEAKSVLTDAGFTCKVSGSDTTAIVTDQVPKPGTSLIDGSTICIYTAENEARVSNEVPNLKGMSLTQAISTLKARNLNIHVVGSSGVVLTQDTIAGTLVEEGSVITVTLQQQITDTH